MKIKILLFGIIALTLTGCKKFLEPDPENFRSVENMYNDPQFAQGFLLQSYRTLPAYYNNSEMATDDAVSNVRDNGYTQIATGSWTNSNGTMSVWNPSYSAILYLNQFLTHSNRVKWSLDPTANTLLNYRMRGEAFGMRALHMYYLLRNHGGVTSDGQLMGVPIMTEFQNKDANFNLPRATFDACMKQIYLDLDSAEYFLPMEYVDITTANQIPARFASITQLPAMYNRAYGDEFKQLFNGLIAKSVRARAALLAASPAFQHASNPATWEQAANIAADIIRHKGGVNSLPTTGFKFYNEQVEIDALARGADPSEIIWREIIRTNATRETENFPPLLFGNGLVNPTQNLVDAFPMADGYPINHPTKSTFVATNPYASRDPRLRAYIFYDSHPDLPALKTGSQSGTIDGINVRANSTRTGYYLRKTLRSDVILTPGSVATKKNYIPRIRYTEMYLIYAEAANEAWGPKGTGPNGFSAYDVIKRIRARAEVGTNNNHAYLDEAAANKDLMRTLIRNERRLELSFEGFRFWDLRRWKENLNETTRGMDVNGTVFSPFDVEPRVYQNFMIYGPIPNSEILKFRNLVQNNGWN